MARVHERAAEALARFREGGAGRAAAVGGRNHGSGVHDPNLRPGTSSPAVRQPELGATALARRRSTKTTKVGEAPPASPHLALPIPAILREVEALSRERLTRRWTWGSTATFRRLEIDGLLVPRLFGTEPMYFWEDVFVYEGGLPPEGLEDRYRMDLLTPEQVARVRGVQPETIYDWVAEGLLPARRVGRFKRFVPEEVVRWMKKVPRGRSGSGRVL